MAEERAKIKKTFYLFVGQQERLETLIPKISFSKILRTALDRLIAQLEQRQESELTDLINQMEDDLDV